MSTPTADPWSSVSARVLVWGSMLLAGLVYLPTLSFNFVYDDHWTILANGFLREPQDLGRLLSPDARALHVPDAFRPTAVVFDMVSYQLLGVQPWRHHALSVGLHVGIVGVVAAWVRGLGAPVAQWSSTAALFGVMAIHAEPVAVVSFHEDLLAAGFGLAALTVADAGGRAAHTRTRLGHGALAGLLMLLAAGAKLNAIALLGLGLLARSLAPWGRPLHRSDLEGGVGLALGAAVALAHRLTIYGGLSPYDPDNPQLAPFHTGWPTILARSASIHLGYLQQMVVPFGLSPEYEVPPGSWSSAGPILALAALIALAAVGGAGAWKRRRPVLALAILGALGLAVPTSHLWPITNLRADRFAYLPSIPVAVGLAALLVALGRRWPARGGGPIAPLVVMLIGQGSLAQSAATAYRSDTRLWDTALRRAPGSARAHAARGQLYIQRLADLDPPDPRVLIRATTHCSIARWRSPELALPWLCEARLAAAQHQWVRADEAFAQALDRGVSRADRVLSAQASIALDRPDRPYPERIARARALARRATSEYPYSALAHATAAQIHHRLADAAQARELYARARILRPERWDVVLAGLELELDLGDAAAARAAWNAHEDLLQQADPARRDHVRRRLRHAERLFRLSPSSPRP